jgi:hypothetical protein
MNDSTRHPTGAARVNRAWYAVAALLAIVIVAGAAWLWRSGTAPQPVPATSQPLPPPVAEASPTPAPPPASEPAIKHPVETLPAAEAPAPAEPSDIGSALTNLFGQKAVLAMFQLDDFAHRLVATVDNLGRTHAPARLWPVNPAAGRFTVDTQDGESVIGADNGLRYTPFVLLMETVDLRQAVKLYVHFYPQFQQAYQDLGYPKGYFNDRLVEVIDLLLATPEPVGPVKVHLPPINGPVQPERPWVLYEFEDPALQALSSGQKVLLRMGPVNERRMKAKLAEIRRLVTATPAPR